VQALSVPAQARDRGIVQADTHRMACYLSWPHGSGRDAILANQRRPVA
jgi:hypothetical protein